MSGFGFYQENERHALSANTVRLRNVVLVTAIAQRKKQFEQLKEILQSNYDCNVSISYFPEGKPDFWFDGTLRDASVVVLGKRECMEGEHFESTALEGLVLERERRFKFKLLAPLSSENQEDLIAAIVGIVDSGR